MPSGSVLKGKIPGMSERRPELMEEAKEWIRKTGNGDPQTRGKEAAIERFGRKKAGVTHSGNEA
ncbi:hypothetical protein MPNT_50122 [Candidatus Methylacidithermus pantelleriae]|uniref:Uncharacterized protein n=1 Tax=Candidatus Methylacidithermus pantelleriae TaxID=2744239 RepID=A0A8J2BUY3_9BACT|nr:hypothetical protein MPNT_50122 [Candidatus Methylacidithermus pantelleriae]